MMTQFIKAPFNFVPLNEKVFFPDWAEKVSHDIPFSDGESGTIELELEAITPVFVRNGHTQADAEAKNNDYISFSKDADGNYFIPGTSIKGMIRNVLEIMSFGKMNLDPKMKYSTRDWENDRIFDLKQVTEQNKVCCGYLKRESGGVVIENHGKPFRINHRRIDEYLNASMLKDYFSKNSRKDLNKPIEGIDPKTAKFKYYLCEKNGIDLSILKNVSFTFDNEYGNERQNRRLRHNNSGDVKGEIVFTGQPDQWSSDQQAQRVKDRGKGKFYEFVFETLPDEFNPKINVPKLMFEQFEFFHKDSDDWNYWKSKFNKGNKIPIFFRHENGKIKDFGLAFLYKIPFKYSPKELSNRTQKNFNFDKPDLAELLFGFTGKTALNGTKEKVSAKGRVQFSKFKAPENTIESDELKTTLGSPKASYYPLYIRQKNGENGKVPFSPGRRGGKSEPYYETYHNEDAAIAGWKRYPVKNRAVPEPLNNEELDSVFRPLPAGTKFTGRIKFHNLKSVEIGALLSAITFHWNNDKLFHQIGMAKPQGFGKVSVLIKSDKMRHSSLHYLSHFEQEMEKQIHSGWLKSDQIKELFSTAEDKTVQLEDFLLQYMHMDTKSEKNEFLSAKKKGEYLQEYTRLSKSSFLPESIARDYMEAQTKKEKEELEKIHQSFVELFAELEKRCDVNDLSKCSELIPAIDLLIERIEHYKTTDDKLTSLNEHFQNLKEYVHFIEIADKLMAEKKWQKAKLLLIEKVLPISSDATKPIVEEKIGLCKKKEGDSLEFTNSVDLSITIDKNKGKIQNYLTKKGKLKLLPENDLDDFYSALKAWYKIDPKKERKEWIEFGFKRSVWKNFVVRWVGEEKAKEFFNKLII